MSLAAVLGLAVIMLAWHNIWVARHGRQMSEDMRRLGRDVMSGARSLMALAVVVGLAVLREGCFFMESSFRAVNQG
jgi:high-affinity iron transporter